MGVFDFLREGSSAKSPPGRMAGMQSVQGRSKQESKGSIQIDSFTFNVWDYSMKGFIIEPYDREILAKGQRFKFEMKVSNGAHVMEGRAEAVVTKISKGALAAAFTLKPKTS